MQKRLAAKRKELVDHELHTSDVMIEAQAAIEALVAQPELREAAVQSSTVLTSLAARKDKHKETMSPEQAYTWRKIPSAMDTTSTCSAPLL